MLAPVTSPADRKERPKLPPGVLLLLFAAETRAAHLLHRAMRTAALTPEEFAVYSTIGFGPVTPAALADLLGVRRSAVSNHLARMADRGDIKRTRDPQDGRSWHVELSAAGLARHQRTQQYFVRVIVPLRQALGPRRESVLLALNDLIDALDQVAASSGTRGQPRRARR